MAVHAVAGWGCKSGWYSWADARYRSRYEHVMGTGMVSLMLRYRTDDRQCGDAWKLGHCIRKTGKMGMHGNCPAGPANPATTLAIPLATRLDTKGASSTGGGYPTSLRFSFHLLAKHPHGNMPALCP